MTPEHAISAVSAGMTVLWFCLYLYYLAILGRQAVPRLDLVWLS